MALIWSICLHWGLGSCNTAIVSRLPSFKARDCDAFHHDGLDWGVLLCWHFGYRNHNIHATDDLTKHRMLRAASRKPVQGGIVGNVEENLRAPRIGLTSICHGKCSKRVRILGCELILDVASFHTALSPTSTL